MENNERILITELRDDKEIDPKKYSMHLLRGLETKGYIELLFDEDKEVTVVNKGKWFADALEIYLKDMVEPENLLISGSSEQDKPEKSYNDRIKNLVQFKSNWIWYILGAIFFIIAIHYLFKANQFLDGKSRIFGDYYSNMNFRYVGGDAYNYIIAGTYSTTITVRALVFVILGSVSVLMGKLSSKLKG